MPASLIIPSASSRVPSTTTETVLAAGTTGRVLVVDDDVNSRTLLADWLSAYGHEVIVAADGPSALREVELKIPDAIVLDVMMPIMDGFAVCEKLKSNPATAIVPVLLLTALHEREDRLRGMRAGANDFLLKPADLPYVLLRVRNAVRLKQLHDEVREKLQEICRQEGLKENLLQMIIHDLRTPLAGLEGFLQLLEIAVGTQLQERPAHYLQQAQKGARRLANHIDLLLDIHRLEEGRMTVQLGPVDLSQLVEKALEPLRPLFGQRKLEVEKPRQPLTAIGDSGLLERVISNLVGNAIAFTTPENGEIVIRLRGSSRSARVEVADNGPGIDSAHQEAIFDKFYQVGSNVRERSSGLGLTFCKLAIDAQYGRIGVVSQLGAGSQFWFDIPAPA